MAHRENIKEFLKTIKIPDGKSVVDWGRGTKPITKYISGNYKYLGIDKLDHVGADMVVNISSQVWLKELYDIAFCMEVLEHVESPEVLIQNIKSNLKPTGKLYMSVPFMYPVHSPEDYWRFTDIGLKLLLERNGFIVKQIIPTEDNMGWIVTATRL